MANSQTEKQSTNKRIDIRVFFNSKYSEKTEEASDFEGKYFDTNITLS